jgi:hypothetical protein
MTEKLARVITPVSRGAASSLRASSSTGALASAPRVSVHDRGAATRPRANHTPKSIQQRQERFDARMKACNDTGGSIAVVRSSWAA